MIDVFCSELCGIAARRAQCGRLRYNARSILASLIIGCLATIASPCARAQQDTELYAAAKNNNETEVTWYQSHFRTEAAEVIIHAFTEKYPGITVSSFNSTAAVAIGTSLRICKRAPRKSNIFSTTDATQMSALKATGNLTIRSCRRTCPDGALG